MLALYCNSLLAVVSQQAIGLPVWRLCQVPVVGGDNNALNFSLHGAFSLCLSEVTLKKC